MSEIWSSVEEFLRANNIASGGLTVLVVGGILAYLRAIPSNIYSWVYYRLVTTVEIRDSDESFEWLRYWLSHHNYSKKSRLIEVASYNVLVNTDTGEPVQNVGVSSVGDDYDAVIFSTPRSKTKKKWIFRFIPGDGWHWFFFKKRLLYVTKTTKENQSAKKRSETITLALVSRKRVIVEELIEEAKILYLGKTDTKDRITIWNAAQAGSYWSDNIERVPRPLSSLVFEGDVVERLVEDIKVFLSKREWYHEMGVPWHRGYLLSGPPGNGKTSLILGLAGEFKRDICMLSLSAGMDEVDFIEKVTEMPQNSILVLEDVDCLNLTVDRSESSSAKDRPVSLSCLMNFLDGLYSPEGLIIFLTTNKIEKLDPTMLRGGRTDIKIEIKNATPGQAVKMFRKFFGQGFFALERDLVSLVESREVSMATIQGAILESIAKPEEFTEILTRDIEYMEEIKNAYQEADTKPGPLESEPELV